MVDWAAQKQIWDHVFANHLAKLPGGVAKKGKLLQGKAVIVTEAYCNLEPVQYAMDLLLFEQYGAHAVWRTTAAGLVGLGGGEVFRSQSPQGSTVADNLKAEDGKRLYTRRGYYGAHRHIRSINLKSISKATRTPSRASTTSTSLLPPHPTHPPTTPPASNPRPRPRLLLLPRHPHPPLPPLPPVHPPPRTRRQDAHQPAQGDALLPTARYDGRELVDVAHLARMSFVAGSVGRRGAGKDMEVLERAWRKEPVEWSYEDLLALERYGKGKGEGEKSVRVTWSLPDYGGGVKSGGKERDRARYGYILDGPNPSRGAANKATSTTANDQSSTRSPGSPPSSPPPTSPPSLAPLHRGRRLGRHPNAHPHHRTLLDRRNALQPDSLSLDQQPLPLLVRDAISSLSSSSLPHARAAADMMWSNIILVGGLANVVGMKRRLENELRSLAPSMSVCAYGVREAPPTSGVKQVMPAW